MENQRKSIHNLFFIYGIIQAVVGAIAILGGIASYASKESTLDLIIAGAGLVALLFTPFTISWGQVVEDTRRTADNTELLIKNGTLYDKSKTSSVNTQKKHDKSGTPIVNTPKKFQESITIPNGITRIEEGAFRDYTSLMSVTSPDSVISIGNDAFLNCTSLASVTIPDSVTSIGGWAFCECYDLTSIVYQGTKAQWNAISKEDYWNDNTGDYTIYCTDGDIKK